VSSPSHHPGPWRDLSRSEAEAAKATRGDVPGIANTTTLLGGVQSACNWAVGSGVTVSMPGYFVCQNNRYRELAGVQQIVDTLDRKSAEQAKRMREAEQRRAREAEEAEAERRRKQWWRLW
jgi:hypothetical protein